MRMGALQRLESHVGECLRKQGFFWKHSWVGKSKHCSIKIGLVKTTGKKKKEGEGEGERRRVWTRLRCVVYMLYVFCVCDVQPLSK